MKPIFCIDITSDKHNETLNGSEFIIRTAPKQKIEEYEAKQENLEQTIEKSKFPVWVQIIKYLSGLFAVIVLGATINAGVDTAWKNAPALVISGAACGVVWLILYIASKGKEKTVLKNENADQQVEELHEDFQDIHYDLDVPANALDIDVLAFKYKNKNGEIRPHTSGLQMTPYANVNVKIYATLDEVSIADLENVYSFEKSEMVSITTVKKRISIPVWHKDEDPRKGKFKPYKMTVNNMGCIFFKPYYILEIKHGDQLFGLYFPCYELETIEALTGLKAERD